MFRKIVILFVLIVLAAAQAQESQKEKLGFVGPVKVVDVVETVSGLEPVPTNHYEFDDSGMLLKAVVNSYDLENKLRFKIVSTYENDRMVRQEKLSPTGELISYSEFDYDAEGNLLEQSSYTGDGTASHRRVYSYENGKVKIEDLFSGETLTRRYINEYDADGNRIKRKRFDINGVLDQERDYNIESNSYKEVSYNSDGEIESRAFGQLDKSGRIIKSTAYTMDGSVQTESTWNYGSTGLLEKEELVVAGDKAEYYYEYEIDEIGNWTKQTVKELLDGKYILLETIERSFEYFK